MLNFQLIPNNFVYLFGAENLTEELLCQVWNRFDESR